MASKFQEKTIQELERRGFLVVKLIRANKNGFGDLIAIKDGKVLIVECKEKKDIVSPLQIYRGKEVKKYGAEFRIFQDGKDNEYPNW
jgi:Holliday junction resolvase